MKRMDLFCRSQASTAICSSMDHHSVVRSHCSNSRAIDRHNPLLRDSRRYSSRNFIKTPTSSSYHQLLPTNIKPKPYYNHTNPNKKKATPTTTTRKTSSKPTDIFTPTFFHVLPDFKPPISDPVSDLALVPIVTNKDPNKTLDLVLKKSAGSTSTTRSTDQVVVVLRVSLHCKGCEGKVRKHISRMQGVKSFSIDFASKKVTIIGDITPVGVLASVSRVKNAQFWPSSALVSSKSIESR